MTNLEKWKEELLKIKYDRINYLHPAVVNGKPVQCAGMDCSDCDLNNPCSDSFIKWLFNEYTEPKPKLTKRQRAFCEAVQTGWLARWKYNTSIVFSGMCVLFENKPRRSEVFNGAWVSPPQEKYTELDATFFPDFPFIQWEDEPYSIEEMLTWEIEDED